MFFSLRMALRRYTLLHRCLVSLKAAVKRVRPAIAGWVRRLPLPFSLGLAPGFYREEELLNQGKVAGRVILTDQGNFEASPDSMLVLCGRKQNQTQPWPVLWTHHHEVELVGDSLAPIDAKGNLSAESTYHNFEKLRAGLDDPAYFFPRLLSKPQRLERNWTSLVSRWTPTSIPYAYGHWILDALPRLAALAEFPPDTGIIVPPFRLPYREESLRMLGLLDRCRWSAERHLQVENFYFSSPTSMIGCYNPYSVGWMRGKFIPLVANDERPTPARFFVRRFGSVRNIVNEQEVLDFFHRLGWSIIDPGQLSFAEQIRYFSRAEAVCGIHGSGFNNTLWCAPGCRIIELFSDDFPASESEWIAMCLPPTQYRSLVFPCDHLLSAKVDLDRVKKTLRELDLS